MRTRSLPLPLLVVCAWCPGQTQHVSAAAFAAATLTVTATNAPTASVPAGTDITGGIIRQAAGSSAFGSAAATTTVSPLGVTPYEVLARLDVAVSLTATQWFTGLGCGCGSYVYNGVAYQADHDILVILQATRPVRGRLVATNSSLGGGHYYGGHIAAVDVGNDGSRELDTWVRQPVADVPVQFGPGSLGVRLENATGLSHYGRFGEITGTFQYSSLLEARFVPDADCTVTEVVPACGAPVLTIHENFAYGVDLRIDNLRPRGQGYAVLVVGAQQAGVTIPIAPGCTLGTPPIWGEWLFPDAAGRAIVEYVDVPAAARPFALFAQCLELDTVALTVETSATLRIDCN